MADLAALKNEVSALNHITSNDFEFMDALDHIEEAAKSTDGDISTLRNILNSFRLKFPDRETLAPDRIRAKDLADTLMLATLGMRIARISARNDALTELAGELQTQIDKANADAGRLKQIRDALDKASKTVVQAKAIIDTLTATDLNTKEKLKKLIDSLAKASSIFAPA